MNKQYFRYELHLVDHYTTGIFNVKLRANMRTLLHASISLLLFCVCYSLNECGNGINLCDVQLKMPATKCYRNDCNGFTQRWTLRCCSTLSKPECLKACNLTDFAIREPCSPRCVNGQRGNDGVCHCDAGFHGHCCDDCIGDNSHCLNGGYCGMVGADKKCYCKDGFYGDRCKYESKTTTFATTKPTKPHSTPKHTTKLTTFKTSLASIQTQKAANPTVKPKPTTLIQTSRTYRIPKITINRTAAVGSTLKSTRSVQHSTTSIMNLKTKGKPTKLTLILDSKTESSTAKRKTTTDRKTTTTKRKTMSEQKTTTERTTTTTERKTTENGIKSFGIESRIPKNASSGPTFEVTTVARRQMSGFSTDTIKVFAVVFFPVACAVLFFTCCFYILKFCNSNEEIHKVIPLTVKPKPDVGDANKRRRGPIRPQIWKY